ncbi:MAG: GAF domain-containing protein, partial [Chloroflexi bacterium]|nr:GAF domain-containing protein [Chloroflexota bacterium]
MNKLINSDLNKTVLPYQILMETAQSLLAARTLAELWTIIITAARQTLQADRVAIFLYNQNSSEAICAAAEGLSETYIQAIRHQALQTPSHQLWEQTEPLIINDVAQDDRTDALRSIMLAEGFQAYAIFPLTTAQ